MMNVGISVPLPAYLVDVGFMARKAEELGFESFFCAEHPFIPVQTSSRFPGSEDGVIPESYSHFIDPFVALARASSVTVYELMRKNVAVVHFILSALPLAARQQAQRDIGPWLETRAARHTIAARFPLAETAAAHAFVESGAELGTVVVRRLRPVADRVTLRRHVGEE